MPIMADRVRVAQCKQCGLQFLAGRKDTVFCGNNCRQTEYRARMIARYGSMTEYRKHAAARTTEHGKRRAGAA
jgi:hypothetical protein